MRKALMILILIGLCAPALAVGKVTSDPNKGGVAATESAPTDLTTDPKLAQKVTYEASGKMVSTILADLTKSTGVALKAGRNSSDWQVRDRKMNVFAKGVPLSEMMSSIARVMKFKWEISGKQGAYTYRLFMDRRTLLDAEAQRTREEQKAEDARTKRREKGLQQYAKLGNLTAEEKAKLKTDNPFMYMVSNAGMGDSLGRFFTESPAASEAIASGQKLEMKGASLTPAGQAGLARAVQQMSALEAKFGGSGRRTIPADLASNMGNVSISINRNMDMMKGFPHAGMLLGEMSVQYEGGSVEVPFLDPESGMVKLIGKAMVQSEQQNRPMNDVMKDLVPEFMTTVMSEVKAEVGGEPLIEHADNPALHNKITLKPQSQTLPDVEKALADASKLAVVSDSFGQAFNFPMGQVPTTESELKDVLDKIGETYIYNWDKHSAVIELRDRNWFKKRAAQIPEAWLEKWRQELTKTGTIDIDNLAQIASLTQEQVTANVMGDDVLRVVTGRIFGDRESLRLYASLSSDQRSALFTDAGIDLRSLSQDQWTQADKTIRSRGGAKLLDSKKRVFISGKREARDKSIVYMFTLTDGDKADNIEWPLVTPTYTPPPPPTPKPADQTKPASGTAPPAADPLGDSPPKPTAK